MAKIMTISVDAQIEKRFRIAAGMKFGRKKGYIGKALNDAMKVWLERQEQEDINKEALEMLHRGFNLGGMNYKSRDELHER